MDKTRHTGLDPASRLYNGLALKLRFVPGFRRKDGLAYSLIKQATNHKSSCLFRSPRPFLILAFIAETDWKTF